MTDGKKIQASQEEIEKALALLKKTKEQQAKYNQRLKDNPELKEKMKMKGTRRRVKDVLLIQWAIAKGATISEKDIDAYLAKATKK